MPDQNDSLLEFPWQFPIKIMGLNCPEFEQAVLGIVQRHCEPNAQPLVKTRESNKGNYLAKTVTIEARNRAQLDAIYQALSTHELVKMAL